MKDANKDLSKPTLDKLRLAFKSRLQSEIEKQATSSTKDENVPKPVPNEYDRHRMILADEITGFFILILKKFKQNCNSKLRLITI